MDGLLERTTAVLSDCRQFGDSTNVQELDRIVLHLKVCLAEIGELLDSILITGHFHLETSAVDSLQELQPCLSQLSAQYEAKLLLLQSNRTTAGRPKKIINLSMASCR